MELIGGISLMPQCKLFRHGVCIGTGGTVRPCCMWNDPGVNDPIWTDDWQTKHEQHHQDSLKGWLPQCKRCQIMEDTGKQSMRQRMNTVVIPDDAQGIVFWDLKVNNTCNLACRMCDTWSSSKWHELNDTPGYTGVTFPQTNKWYSTAMDFVDEMRLAREIKFTGGEPFLIPQVKRIQEQLVEQGVAGDIKLHIITNGTQDITQWMHIWQHFKTVRLSISVDALGDRYEYIRPYSSWNTVNNNVKALADYLKSVYNKNNISVFVNSLPMILNKNNLDEVAQWATELGFKHTVTGVITEPEYLKPDVQNDPVLWKQFVSQMSALDKRLGTNWRDFVHE